MNADSTLDLFSLAGKVALVTGGVHGLGRMIADGLAGAGADVLVSTRPVAASVQRSACPHRVLEAQLDSNADLTDFAAQVGSVTGHLDILVNNVGGTAYAPLAEYPDEAFDQVLRLNVTTAFGVTRRCLSLLAAAPGGAPGRVINIGSTAGLRPGGRDNFAYSASKAALHMLTRQLALELAPRGICVNALAPGPFPAPLMEGSALRRGGVDVVIAGVPLGRLGSPADIAGATIFLGSAASAYVTGVILPVDGGISAG
jgi:NAD(P)-dependent dehydrogenase (short-subunit alcohol dehydrogenase family)